MYKPDILKYVYLEHSQHDLLNEDTLDTYEEEENYISYFKFIEVECVSDYNGKCYIIESDKYPGELITLHFEEETI